MKKLGIVLGLTLLGASSLFADYQLILTNKDGEQTKQCIKSYSFSNNLESLARKNSVGLKDVYSEEETMTNKIYLGKPVYRKVIPLDDFSVKHGQKIIKYSDIVSQDLEKVVRFIYSYNLNGVFYYNPNDYVRYNPGLAYTGIRFFYTEKKARVQFVQQHPSDTTTWNITNFNFEIEYTKTTDKINSSSNTFKSYIGYVLSSSENETVITKDMKNLGVQILENYTYDKDTDSCTAK